MPLSIVLQSNATWVSSGYGSTTNLLRKMWQSMGHRVAVFANFGLEGGFITVDGVEVLPRGVQQWGDDVVWAHCQRWGADLLITNIDTFVLRNYGSGKKPWIPIVPVMEDPLSPGIANSLRGAHSLVSISKYGKQTLEDKGWGSTLIPLPVDTGKFFPLNRRDAKTFMSAYTGFPADAYVVGHVGMNRGNRKGHDLLIRAFAKFLAEVPNAYLYIHTHSRQHDGLNLEGLVNDLGIASHVKFPDAYDAFYGKPDDWMNALFNSFDIYVQPSRNEGQGMPLWEAFAVGCPVIATENTALSEAISEAEGIALPVINKEWLQGEGYAYPTSSDAILEALLSAHQKWSTDYISMHNRQWAIENVSVNVVGHKWQQFLLDHEKKLRFTPQYRPWGGGRPKVIQVSTTVQNCGVGAYTRALMAGFGDTTDCECIEIRTLTSANDIPPCDIVHIQHEPSVVPPNDVLEPIMDSLRKRGTKVVTTYHNVIPDIVNAHLSNNLTDMAMIHWPPPGMKTEDKRVYLIGGMGCPTFTNIRDDLRPAIRAQCGFSNDDVIISTFGFAAVGRGHVEVPMEMIATMKVREELKLLLPGNFLNEEGKSYVHDTVHRLVEEHGLKGRIVTVDQFLPDTEVLRRLWMSDVGYLYLGSDTLSSSSAIRYFISARLPLVITPSTHFGDVRRGVVVTDTFSLPEFVAKILDLADDVPLRARLSRDHKETYDWWVWPKFAERHLAAYKRCLGV
jgi:glycosyltransferase involved in cell wall biosynthesis